MDEEGGMKEVEPGGTVPVEAGGGLGEKAGQETAAGPKTPGKGRFKRLFAEKQVWVGIAVGALLVVLVGGIFAIGFAVGRHGEGCRAWPGVRRWCAPERGMRERPPGQRGPGRWLRPRGAIGEHYEEIESAVADALGMSVDDLREELEGGRTIADVAAEKGVSTDDLARVAAARIGEIADRLLAGGEITSRQAERIKENAEQAASRIVKGGWMGMPGGCPFMDHDGGGLEKD